MATKRRGNGEGSIRKRKDGRWSARIDLGWIDVKEDDGAIARKRHRPEVYGKTRKEVQEKLEAMKRDQHLGAPVAPERQTVAQFLDKWLAEKIGPQRKPKTHHSYAQMVRLHIRPTIGAIQLAKLTPLDVQTLLNQKQAEGLAPRTVQYIRGILRAALTQAVKWSMVPRNVAALADPPKVERFVTHPLTPAQAQTFLDTARDDRLEALYRVALSLGLRQGEALGLRWEDVDFAARTLRVEVSLQLVNGKLQLSTPKTEGSRRTLALPAALVTALKAHQVRQLEERLWAGARWKDHGLVFCTSIGTPISPRNLVRDFKKLLQRAGLPDIRFHDLRHSCASLLAAQGVPVRVAMEVLGHANITTTQNIYTHVFDDAKRQAADVMDKLFGDAREAV